MQASRPLPSSSSPLTRLRRLDFGSGFDSQVFRLAAPAVVIGVGAGLAAVVFRWLIHVATIVFSGHEDYSAVVGHPANPWVPWLGPWFVVLAPAIGGLLYGPVVQRWAPEARGHGVPEVMRAISSNGGRIRGSVAAVKALASAVCIGSGGSVGREGPIIQIGSALGSALGQRMRLPGSRLSTLVACGAAGGVSATFNAPLGGIFFALELLLQDFSPASFGAVTISSVIAALIGRAAFGGQPFISLPHLDTIRPEDYLLVLLLGLVTGAIGIGFARAIYLVEDVCDSVWGKTRWPEWARPAVGGLALGLVLLAVPQMYGVGYPVLERSMLGTMAVGTLVVLLLAKILATSLTLGIGGSGGVFAPSLFVGAMSGAAFGDVAAHIDPSLAGHTALFAVVGMAGAFAGSTRAPITGAVMLFELTAAPALVLPLVLAVVPATAVSRILSHGTVYTLKLTRREDRAEAAPVTPVRPEEHAEDTEPARA